MGSHRAYSCDAIFNGILEAWGGAFGQWEFSSIRQVGAGNGSELKSFQAHLPKPMPPPLPCQQSENEAGDGVW